MDKKEVYDQVKEESGTVFKSVGLFAMINPVLNSIAISTSETARQAGHLEHNLGMLFGQKLAETSTPDKPAPEKKEKLSTTTGRMRSRGMDLAGLGLIIPFLVNKESRDYLASFISGLIGKDNLELINTGLIALTSVLTGVFTVKLFKQVSDTIKTFKKLSELTATLFQSVSDGADGVNEKDEALEKKKDKMREQAKKRQAKKKKRKAAELKRRQANRAKRLKRIKQIKRAKSVISNLKKALLVGGPFGIAAGIVGGIAIGSMIDLIAGPEETSLEDTEKEDTGGPDEPELEEDEDGIPIEPDTDEPVAEPEEKEAEFSASNLGSVIADNAIQELSMGFLDKEGIKKAWDWVKGKVFGSEDKKPATESKPTPVSSKTTESPKQTPSPTSTTTPPTASATPEPDTKESGQTLAKASEDVSGAKKDMAAGNVTVNNINNSTTVVKKNEPATTETTHSYSSTVGA